MIRPVNRMMNSVEREVFANYAHLAYANKHLFSNRAFRITGDKIKFRIIAAGGLNLFRKNRVLLVVENVSKGPIFLFPYRVDPAGIDLREYSTNDLKYSYALFPVVTGQTYLKEISPDSAYTQGVWILPRDTGKKLRFEIVLYRINELTFGEKRSVHTSFDPVDSYVFFCNVK